MSYLPDKHVKDIDCSGGEIYLANEKYKVTVPEGAVESRTTCTLQVFQVSDTSFYGSEKNGCQLDSASAIVRLKKNKKLQGYLEYQIVQPRTLKGKAWSIMSTYKHRRHVMRISVGVPRDIDDYCLAMFDLTSKDKWSLVPSVELIGDGDVLRFKLNSNIECFILLCTIGECDELQGVHFIQQLIKKNNFDTFGFLLADLNASVAQGGISLGAGCATVAGCATAAIASPVAIVAAPVIGITAGGIYCATKWNHREKKDTQNLRYTGISFTAGVGATLVAAAPLSLPLAAAVGVGSAFLILKSLWKSEN